MALFRRTFPGVLGASVWADYDPFRALWTLVIHFVNAPGMTPKPPPNKNDLVRIGSTRHRKRTRNDPQTIPDENDIVVPFGDLLEI